MMYYLDFNQAFEMHTDSSDYQMGVLVNQMGRQVVYWSKKLSDTQKKYPTAGQELLVIVECLKQYKTMLFEQFLYGKVSSCEKRMYTLHVVYMNFR